MAVATSEPARSRAGARQRMIAGVPVSERRLKLAGVSTALLEGGDGPPLVLLHGGIECGGAYWMPVVSRLAESHLVVIPDVPGLGESDPFARLDVASFDAWLAELLTETCAEEPVLVAHSLGGSLAARFAVQHGSLIRRLAIFAAPGIGPYRMPLRLRVAAIRFAVRPSERSAERFERFALLDLDRTRERDPEWFAAFTAYIVSRAGEPHVKRTMRELIKLGTERIPDSDLRSIAAPTALVWGEGDRMVPLDLARATRARVGWPLEVIERTAHVPQIERPDAFVRALAAATGEVTE